jgi:hypothetical protein
VHAYRHADCWPARGTLRRLTAHSGLDRPARGARLEAERSSMSSHRASGTLVRSACLVGLCGRSPRERHSCAGAWAWRFGRQPRGRLCDPSLRSTLTSLPVGLVPAQPSPVPCAAEVLRKQCRTRQLLLHPATPWGTQFPGRERVPLHPKESAMHSFVRGAFHFEPRRVCALLGGSGQPPPPVERTARIAVLLSKPPMSSAATTPRDCREPLAA